MAAKDTAQQIYQKIFDQAIHGHSTEMPTKMRSSDASLTEMEEEFLQAELLLKKAEKHIAYADQTDHYKVIDVNGLYELAQGTRLSITDGPLDFDALPKPGCSIEAIVKDPSKETGLGGHAS